MPDTLLYHCTCCRYTFPSPHRPGRCPDCGKVLNAAKRPAVRIATWQESEEYLLLQREFAQEEQDCYLSAAGL